jgi:hypothetical protein
MKSNLLIFLLIAQFSNAQQYKYTISDLIRISKYQFGFVEVNGAINLNYGDIECISADKSLFDFNVGCGRGGDVITILIKPNSTKPNSFDMIRQKGDKYYGIINPSDKKIGELNIKSESEIKGYINLCLSKDAACCGAEGPSFILKKIKS